MFHSNFSLRQHSDNRTAAATVTPVAEDTVVAKVAKVATAADKVATVVARVVTV